jgi:cytochrome c biogenesis protein CcdA/thiol-disulfide isomerase/thioredoxin
VNPFLVLIAFAAGVITSVSPCVFPVLPLVFAGGASGGRRRPYAIIAGLVSSFALFTLFAAWILDQLGLPKDLLRNLSIAFLFLLAATLLVPAVGRWIERPFLILTRRRSGDLGGGFLLGASLGLVFVPCAGPVLGVITTQAARLNFGWETLVITLAYALGAAVPMFLVAVGGQRSTALQSFRRHQGEARMALGALMLAAALAITFNLDTKLQTWAGNYTGFLQDKVEKSSLARKELAKVTGADKSKLQQSIANGGKRKAALADMRHHSSLPDFGPAPDFYGVSPWLNTPGGKPLSLPQLRGKVVLVDFMTYSCINCIRTFPHLKSWYAQYRKDGLVIVGVHTPEFAFEHEFSNVRKAMAGFGIRYPVVLDNNYVIWNRYANQYWPAEYLIDIHGNIRHAHFGEGDYEGTEKAIRDLLAERGGRLPGMAEVQDRTPTGHLTPESYLGYGRLDRFSGAPVRDDRYETYRFPGSLSRSELAYSGRWLVGMQQITAGAGAALRIHFLARKVYLVMGGKGPVQVLVDGKRVRTVNVGGIARLYTLLSYPQIKDALLELRFSPGVEGYAFTFG